MSAQNPIGEVLQWLLSEAGQDPTQRALQPHQLQEPDDLRIEKTIAEQLYPIMRGVRPDPAPSRPVWTPDNVRQYIDKRDQQMQKIYNDPRYQDYLEPRTEDPIAQLARTVMASLSQTDRKPIGRDWADESPDAYEENKHFNRWRPNPNEAYENWVPAPQIPQAVPSEERPEPNPEWDE